MSRLSAVTRWEGILQSAACAANSLPISSGSSLESPWKEFVWSNDFAEEFVRSNAFASSSGPMPSLTGLKMPSLAFSWVCLSSLASAQIRSRMG